MAISYPPKVWKALKLLWESSPKITWQQLVDDIAETLQCDVPSGSVVRRRAMAEKWKKTVKKQVKSDNKSLKKKTSKVTSENDDKLTENKEENDVINPVILMSDSGQNDGFEQVKQQATANSVKSSQIILNLRNRSFRLGAFFDITMESIEHVRDEVISLGEFTDEEMALPHDELEKLMMARQFSIRQKMSFVGGLSELGDTMSKALERIAKVECVAWGLEPDSFKDSADIKAQRSAALKDMDEKLQESRKIMLEDKKKALMRDVSAIEAGEPTAEERAAFDHNDVYDDDDFIVEAEANGNELE